MRVFVTGAAGFVGSRVVTRLIERGYHVAVLLRESSNVERIQNLLSSVDVIYGNFSEIGALTPALESYAPDVAIHLAWSGVKSGERNNKNQFDNVVASINLLNTLQALGCRYFIGLGSQAEYGPYPGCLDETALTRPTTMYGAAKLATSILLNRLAVLNDQKFAWLRLFSSYGPNDDPNWLIPYTIQSIFDGSRPVLTAGDQYWDYIHVDDVADAVVSVLQTQASGVFNVGSGTARQLRGIIEFIRDLINPSAELGFGELNYREDQVMYLQADINAIRSATGWQPKIQLEDGLYQTIEWHKRNLAK